AEPRENSGKDFFRINLTRDFTNRRESGAESGRDEIFRFPPADKFVGLLKRIGRPLQSIPTAHSRHCDDPRACFLSRYKAVYNGLLERLKPPVTASTHQDRTFRPRA